MAISARVSPADVVRQRRPVSPKVMESLQRVRDFYAAGRQSRDEHDGPRMPPGTMEAADKLAARRGGPAPQRPAGMQPEMLRKARKFANEYTERELDRLISMCERHDYPLGVAHVIRLLSIPEPDRDGLAREAAGGGWPHRRLEDEIFLRYGNRRSGNPNDGRRRRQTPAGDRDACLQITRMCEQWRRLYGALRETRGEGGQGGETTPSNAPPYKDLPRSLRDQLREANEAIRRLRKLAERKLAEVADRVGSRL